MEYTKEALSFEVQADRLLKRGLVADRDELIQRLSSVSYYRLSGYLYPYRKEGSDEFREGTRLGEVWNRYCFDRRLRVLMLDAIERIEVSIRTKTVYHFSHAHGAFGYCDVSAFPKMKNRKTFPNWHGAHKLRNDRSGILIMMCWDFLRKISPTSRWRERVEALFREYPEVPSINLGLTEDWMNHPIWKP
tara:strand:- start:30290 stop:30859 length:570 start_codon:yes stop_codon:yes gene_type:complete